MNWWIVAGFFTLAWLSVDAEFLDLETNHNRYHSSAYVGCALICLIPALLLGHGFA